MKTIKCSKCKKKMLIKREERVLIPPEDLDWDSMTEGQQAEYIMEEMSDAPDNFSELHITYECPVCKKREIRIFI